MSNSDLGSEENELSRENEASDSAADQEDAKKIEERYQELFGHEKYDDIDENALLNLQDSEAKNNSGLANSFEMIEQFEMLEQQVAHANAIGAKPKPAADEMVIPVDEIVMPVPVPAEARETDYD